MLKAIEHALPVQIEAVKGLTDLEMRDY